MDQQTITDARDAVATAVASLERRSQHLEGLLAAAQRTRRDYLADIVRTLLPAISRKVLDNLRAFLPQFVDPTVVQAFADNYKLLGVIPLSGSQQVLAILQTRLAAHLEQAGHGELPSLNAEVERLKSELAQVDHARAGAAALLPAVEAARQNGTIPEAARPYLNRLATAGTALRPPTSRPVASVGTSDDFDFWLYLLTDLPTSFRTMLLSAVTHHHHRDEGASTAQAIASPTPDADALVAPAALGIAIDDSLGRFS
ncbi:hypothetical protein [Cupriavidus sp. USMAA2-4]|jgi:hypothetical protein|uniref:hypothetical protein n=1 Tax=Cupriavidus sp. USMAA2-4 TaxID=876364 RepID=UPI0012F4B579|nr:hypothetical protein [Cupriavidus sp. USMAA2-4]